MLAEERPGVTQFITMNVIVEFPEQINVATGSASRVASTGVTAAEA